eukprot:1139079-Pelagomonas_calceolata.AAC.8
MGWLSVSGGQPAQRSSRAVRYGHVLLQRLACVLLAMMKGGLAMPALLMRGLLLRPVCVRPPLMVVLLGLALQCVCGGVSGRGGEQKALHAPRHALDGAALVDLGKVIGLLG